MSRFNKTSAPSRYKKAPVNVRTIDAVKVIKAADRVVEAAQVMRVVSYEKRAITDMVKVTSKDQAIARLFV